MSDPVVTVIHLVACARCQRHVRTSETLCPFCGDALPMSLRGSAAPRVPAGRLGRAAIFAFGTALAAATGCGESHTEDAGPGVDAGAMADAGFDSGAIVAAYGTPADAGPDDAGSGDAGSGDAGLADAGFDAALILPPYGAPPADGPHSVV